jgi:hypothetical protein
MHQRCKRCLTADGFDFHVPDEVWAAVVPMRLRNHVLCLACFDALASVGGVGYAPHVTAVYFSGAAGAFEFKVTAAADLVSSRRFPATPSRGIGCTVRP